MIKVLKICGVFTKWKSACNEEGWQEEDKKKGNGEGELRWEGGVESSHAFYELGRANRDKALSKVTTNLATCSYAVLWKCNTNLFLEWFSNMPISLYIFTYYHRCPMNKMLISFKF